MFQRWIQMNASTSWTMPSHIFNKKSLFNPAPLGYFYHAPHWGGGYFEPPPPLISETTGPILKIQAAFESPGKTVEENKFY